MTAAKATSRPGMSCTYADGVAFPDDALADEEEIVLHLHPHAKAAVRPILVLVGWAVLGTALAISFGGRIVDLGAGHGLLAHALLLLDDSSPLAMVVVPPVTETRDAVSDPPLSITSEELSRISVPLTFTRLAVLIVRRPVPPFPTVRSAGSWASPPCTSASTPCP